MSRQHLNCPYNSGTFEQGYLVDELWQDQTRRREIRLGEQVHSWDIHREEDLNQNFMLAQASKELDVILWPHIASFQKFLDGPDLNQCGAEACVFKKRVQAQKWEWNNNGLLKMAWADLMISYPADSFMADLECLTTLEARMFENSEARPAGNQQWGPQKL
ncbi:hypothetical protein F4604DRAFT_1978576 [Suillus subluteus]|nr:hypothetical protein F4604DRAFT_1978576 [Suillus subluteus]